MRLSIDKRDPGFSHRAVGLRARIYLDGQEVRGCVTADEEEDLIVRYKTLEDGQTLVKNDAGDAFVLETVRGKVRIDLLGDDGLSLKEPKVAVERSGHDGAIEVFVYSRLRPRASKRHRIGAHEQPGLPNRCEALVALVAATLAEENIAQYGDFYEPRYVAQLAGERLRELLDSESQTRRTIEAAARSH